VGRRADWLRGTAGWSSRRPAIDLVMDVPDARSRHVELPGGGRLFVHEIAGPPGAPAVVLLHGWGGTAAGNWATSMPALARHYRVIAPDLRSHDTAAVDDVIELADALDVERFIAVGYSLGSVVAARLAAHHPDRVQAMVLCAPAGVSVPPKVAAGDDDLPTAVVVTRLDRIVPARRQLELARSLPGASVHPVDGNHFAFNRDDVFVPVLLEACQAVVHRSDDQQETV
jgi:pimeloyl-ACP methyl ester carboxylesterase